MLHRTAPGNRFEMFADSSGIVQNLVVTND